MIRYLFLSLCVIAINGAHFNGGTIRWVPVDLYDNSSSTIITIIQSYSWTYPTVTCATDVPISTAGRSSQNVNLTCISDCLTDGGYSTKPINILTDCVATSSSLGMMASLQSKNISLSSGAHFFLAYQGSAWIGLKNPPKTNFAWSISCFIDLRMRSDGFINTPPVVSVISPQYVIVNKTLDIQILVSDVNMNDDVRCRWSQNSTISLVNECGGICYPDSMPTGTTLSNCTLSFKGTVAGTWYAVAIQVEDFINETSLVRMSSIPVQFLIYVTSEPVCSEKPVIMSLTGCLEITVGVLTSINLFVLNLCDPNVTSIADIILTDNSKGIQMGLLTNSSMNASLFYKTLTWTPQANQIGSQQVCMIAYTEEFVQSMEYCATFTVITSADLCTTTTSTTTTTTTTTTMSTSTATSTTSISTVVTEVVTSTHAPEHGISWGLVAGILSAALLLTLCSCCCLYRLLWSPIARRRRQEEKQKKEERKKKDGKKDENEYQSSYLSSSIKSAAPLVLETNKNVQIEVPKKTYQVYNVLSKENTMNSRCSTDENHGSILISLYNKTNARRSNSVQIYNPEQSSETRNTWIQRPSRVSINNDISSIQHATLADSTVSQISNFRTTKENFDINHRLHDQETGRAFSTPPFNTGRFSILPSRPETQTGISRSRSSGGRLSNFTEWAQIYLFGNEHETGIPRISKLPK